LNLSSFLEVYSPSSVKSQPSNIKASIYHNASKLHGDDSGGRAFILPSRRSGNDSSVILNDKNLTANQQHTISTNETYDRPKSYDNVVLMSTPVDRNNNHVFISPQKRDKAKKEDENT
jgi:hypothetical protein